MKLFKSYPEVESKYETNVSIVYEIPEQDAHDLKENHNIGSGSRVALLLPRTYHFPELVLALNKIGAAFIPIDPMYPIKRIAHMLNIADADCIIITEAFAGLYDFEVNVISA